MEIENVGCPEFDWVDSCTLTQASDGCLEEAGTTVKIQNHIFFLKSYTKDQLKEFSRVVQESINYELNKRLGLTK